LGRRELVEQFLIWIRRRLDVDQAVSSECPVFDAARSILQVRRQAGYVVEPLLAHAFADRWHRLVCSGQVDGDLTRSNLTLDTTGQARHEIALYNQEEQYGGDSEQDRAGHDTIPRRIEPSEKRGHTDACYPIVWT
jgi:hypothetical protein